MVACCCDAPCWRTIGLVCILDFSPLKLGFLLISNLPPFRSTLHLLEFLFISRDFVTLYPHPRNCESALAFCIFSSVSLLHLFLNYLRELNHNIHSFVCLYICAFTHATNVYRWHNRALEIPYSLMDSWVQIFHLNYGYIHFTLFPYCVFHCQIAATI